jgi:murein DD-endopeptidase MepM/ murein hydrolase activator NlpD
MQPISSVSQVWRTVGSRSYVVRRGDSWTSIAAAKRSTAAALATANRLPLNRRPPVGSRIQVPGSWRCPVPSGRFINDFGFPRAAGRLHQGNDLFSSRGTPVVAPVSGRAERAPNGIGGNAVQLHGDDGNRYYLAHLDRYGTAGRVSAGSVIGYVGNTGNAITTPPHLHFEVHPRGGSAINPFPTITLACRR